MQGHAFKWQIGLEKLNINRNTKQSCKAREFPGRFFSTPGVLPAFNQLCGLVPQETFHLR
jgi:hypothetical protein